MPIYKRVVIGSVATVAGSATSLGLSFFGASQGSQAITNAIKSEARNALNYLAQMQLTIPAQQLPVTVSMLAALASLPDSFNANLSLPQIQIALSTLLSLNVSSNSTGVMQEVNQAADQIGVYGFYLILCLGLIVTLLLAAVGSSTTHSCYQHARLNNVDGRVKRLEEAEPASPSREFHA